MVSGEHPLGIPVQNRAALPAGEREDRARRGPPDSRQCDEFLERVGEPATVIREHRARRGVEVTPARVVSETAPQLENLVEPGGGERVHVGEPCHETFEVRDDCRHPGLLEHDLRDPHPVEGGVPLPGEVVAAVPVEPGEKRVRE